MFFKYPDLSSVGEVHKVILATPFNSLQPGLLTRARRSGSADWWLCHQEGSCDFQGWNEPLPDCLILLQGQNTRLSFPVKHDSRNGKWWHEGMVDKWFGTDGKAEEGFHPKVAYLFGPRTVMETLQPAPGDQEFLSWVEKTRQQQKYAEAVFLLCEKDREAGVFALLPGNPPPEVKEHQGGDSFFQE